MLYSLLNRLKNNRIASIKHRLVIHLSKQILNTSNRVKWRKNGLNWSSMVKIALKALNLMYYNELKKLKMEKIKLF